jgi:hypothetical protein
MFTVESFQCKYIKMKKTNFPPETRSARYADLIDYAPSLPHAPASGRLTYLCRRGKSRLGGDEISLQVFR